MISLFASKTKIFSIAGLVIMCACGIGLVTLLVITIVNGKDDFKNVTREPFELDEFLESKFAGKSWNATWITGTELLYKTATGDISKFNVQTQENELFLSKSVLEDFPGNNIKVSEDLKYVLIEYNTTSVFRHSTTSLYTVYNLQTREGFNLHEGQYIQYAMFDPIGHGVVYVFENNIYFLSEPNSTPSKITQEGKPGVFYCGVPDWVYEEEVLASGSAMWFSPDGTKLAYACFDDKDVRNFTYILYGNPGSLEDQYTMPVTIRYPKVGTPNPIVKLYIVDLATNNPIDLDIPEQQNDDNNDYILYDVLWITNSLISLFSTNRIQNKSVLTKCDISSNSCEEEEKWEEINGWIEPVSPTYSKTGTERLQILPKQEGDDAFDHIVFKNLINNESKWLTKGRRVVNTIYAWDEENGLIYYGGSEEDTPSRQQVYVVDLEGVDKCLTCDMDVFGEKCTNAVAQFSKDNSYYTKACRGPNPTYVEIQNTKNENDKILWESNEELNTKLASKLVPQIEYLNVPLSNGFQARVKILKPANFDANKKYPTINYVYAGPNSNGISTAYSAGFENYIVSNKEYIYVYIDGRGSGRDGKNKLYQVYRKLATAEIEDQIETVKYLQDNYPYIDKENTGIWGWSYGGFATAWSLVKDKENVFKCGISVAPVTSFIYYDSIYTERYMSLPTEADNLEGYNNTDLTRNVDNFRNKTFYLIHGNADDNVHYQQSMVLAKALETADIPFEQQSYPDENHSLTYVKPHLYHGMDAFWKRCFVSNEVVDTIKKENSNAI